MNAAIKNPNPTFSIFERSDSDNQPQGDNMCIAYITTAMTATKKSPPFRQASTCESSPGVVGCARNP